MAAIELQIELLRSLVAHDVKQPLVKLQREVTACQTAYEQESAAGLLPVSLRVTSTLRQVLNIVASLYNEEDARDLSKLAQSGEDRDEARAELYNFLVKISENVSDCFFKTRALMSYAIFSELRTHSLFLVKLGSLIQSLASVRSIIYDFLTIVGKPYSNGQSIDIREVIRSAISVKAIREGSTIKLSFEAGASGRLSIHANPYYLLFVFRQIVGNSVKHSSRCPVEITIRGCECASVPPDLCNYFVPAPPEGPVLVFEIIDRGDGISPDTLVRLQSAFVREGDDLASVHDRDQSDDESSDRESDGMGIGLKICNQILKQYSGKLAITSSTKTGTTMSIVIPIQAGGQA